MLFQSSHTTDNLLRRLIGELRQFRFQMEFRMSQTDDLIATLKTDMEALQQKVVDNTTLLQGFSAALTAALANASGAGATPDQLAALTDLDTQMKQATADLTTADTSNPLPAAPTAPVEPIPPVDNPGPAA